jgi:hypothetical protein
MKAAEQLSSMADKVAGFAISSNLLLIFACLKKDISSWVQNQTMAFVIGTCVAGVVYVTAVWLFHCEEVAVLDKASDLGVLTDVSWWLVWARSLGIAAFTGIGILAVLGSSKEP